MLLIYVCMCCINSLIPAITYSYTQYFKYARLKLETHVSRIHRLYNYQCGRILELSILFLLQTLALLYCVILREYICMNPFAIFVDSCKKVFLGIIIRSDSLEAV